MSKLYVIVDMQNDFITGPLGTKEALIAKENILKYVKENISPFDTIIFTRDTHKKNYLQTPEGKALPIRHCIKNTEGWRIDVDIFNTVEATGATIHEINKNTFGATGDFIRFCQKWRGYDYEEIVFMGTCTDICVVSTALIAKSVQHNNKIYSFPIKVIANCCAGTTPEKHEAALQVMESCQIEVIR